MRINDIEKFFNENVTKSELSQISLDKENGISLINSAKLSFDFDTLNDKIKTSDTIFFKSNKIIFVEFKSGGIKKIDFRLKATESIISFYNYIFENGFVEKMSFPNENFQIYFIYNSTSSPAALFTFSTVERELTNEYKHLFSKLKVIDNNRFKKLFGI